MIILEHSFPENPFIRTNNHEDLRILRGYFDIVDLNVPFLARNASLESGEDYHEFHYYATRNLSEDGILMFHHEHNGLKELIVVTPSLFKLVAIDHIIIKPSLGERVLNCLSKYYKMIES